MQSLFRINQFKGLVPNKAAFTVSEVQQVGVTGLRSIMGNFKVIEIYNNIQLCLNVFPE